MYKYRVLDDEGSVLCGGPFGYREACEVAERQLKNNPEMYNTAVEKIREPRLIPGGIVKIFFRDEIP